MMPVKWHSKEQKHTWMECLTWNVDCQVIGQQKEKADGDPRNLQFAMLILYFVALFLNRILIAFFAILFHPYSY